MHASRGDELWTLPMLLVALSWLLPMMSDAAAADVPPSRCQDVNGNAYLLATPQIPDPLCPLAHAASAASTIKIFAAVATVADPLETHLGRAFDSQLSALIRAFDAKGYVLDGFALTWRLVRVEPGERAGSRIPENGTASYAAQQRQRPSVLVFRKDLWRALEEGAESGTMEKGSEYFVVFLVGESPTFGVHPHAFKDAVICAARLAGGADADLLARPCNADADDNPSAEVALDLIGPSFSGSMDSLALVLGTLLADRPGLSVALRSPSATVESNAGIKQWIERIAGVDDRVTYTSLAASLKQQLNRLATYTQEQNINGKILILAEASTFGHGVSELLNRERTQSPSPDLAGQTDADARAWTAFVKSASVTSFPQNIAAIRAEHARIDKQQSEPLRNLLKVQRSLLELDLSGVDENIDRPPAYRRELSTRSDELMLYGTFDALRVWVDPAVVVIVATDVRDRLFLLNEVRKSLPNALPVLMEMDYLTAHPDYRKISRGALVIPSGRTVLCVDQDGSLVKCGKGTSYLSFPADYAANMFRAIVGLIGDGQVGRATERSDAAMPVTPSGRVWVTTLAGFQTVDEERLRSKLLAAEGRMLLERPVPALFLIVGLWVVAIACWLLTFGRKHLVMLSPLRHFNPFPGVREAQYGPAAADCEDAMDARVLLNRWLSVMLLGLGVAVVTIAGIRLYALLFSATPELTWSLSHGRDRLMLIGLFLLYLCTAIIAGWRLYLWRGRCRGHLESLADVVGIAPRISRGSSHGLIALSSAAVVIAALLVFAWYSGLPHAVDPIWPIMVIDSVLLLLGIWFIAEMWSESRRLASLAQLLAPIAEIPAEPADTGQDRTGDARGGGSWASPVRLHALPQSPFSLTFRKRDLGALLAYPDETWRAQNRALLAHGWPFDRGSNRNFAAWQARLVAELRYGLAAIRSCAWAAILAPTTLLFGMALYPPFAERTMTTASVVLILVAFGLVMYVVIKLEQHPLLGRMFTQNGDHLSVGGAIGALWGKLAMASVILIPVLFPDVLSSLYGLLQSINSLQ